MSDTDVVFKALGDPLRLRILQFLKRPAAGCCTFDQAVCACDLEGVLGLSQPTISHHMKLLVQAGLIRSEKRGRWVHYSLNPDRLRDVADILLELADTGPSVSPTASLSPKPLRSGENR